jgi:hypothetical protein
MITLTITQWPRLQRPRPLSALRLLVGDHHYLETRPLGLACFGISQGKVRDMTKCWMSQVPGISAADIISQRSWHHFAARSQH